MEKPKQLPLDRFGNRVGGRSFASYLGGLAAALATVSVRSDPAFVPMEPKATAKPTKKTLRHLRGSALGSSGNGSHPVPGGGERERLRRIRQMQAANEKREARLAAETDGR